MQWPTWMCDMRAGCRDFTIRCVSLIHSLYHRVCLARPWMHVRVPCRVYIVRHRELILTSDGSVGFGRTQCPRNQPEETHTREYLPVETIFSNGGLIEEPSIVNRVSLLRHLQAHFPLSPSVYVQIVGAVHPTFLQQHDYEQSLK